MNVLSLFDGISCGQIALNKQGIKYNKYYACEIDQPAINITQHNYPETIQLGDVTKVSASDLPKIDLIIGGSPCQSFSALGKGEGFDGKSGLFFEYVRLLEEVRKVNPDVLFLLENVKMKKEWRDVITQHMGVEPIEINSSLVSAAKRTRLYWTNIKGVTVPKDKNISFDDIDDGTRNWIEDERIAKIAAWKAQQKPLKNATTIGSRGKLPCLTARGYNQYHSGMILITDGQNYRYLTNEEAEKAHNLPVGYTSIGNDRERSHAIGNGWTVDVIAHIFSHI